ncbi:MAG TPA: WHG domain-containing protein [Pseudonocardiaceae bacterium]|nr:WHG domain-containing protein [Pseudonocardiaceae bacterium]
MTDEMRTQLVAAAVRLLTEGGPEALRARRLATEVSASTMAVYTHFGGMARLLDAVAEEGFRRMSAALASAPSTDDAVANLLLLAYAYRNTANVNPNLYALTFGQVAVGGHRAAIRNLTDPEPRTEPDEGARAFGYLLDAAAAAIYSGRFSPVEPRSAAAQLWSGLHGYVTLEMSGAFGPAGQGLVHIFGPLARTLAIGLGDTPEAAAESLRITNEAWETRPTASRPATKAG